MINRKFKEKTFLVQKDELEVEQELKIEEHELFEPTPSSVLLIAERRPRKRRE